MGNAIKWAKKKAHRYWFIVLVWAEWLAVYIGRSFFVPFIYTLSDTKRYDTFQTLKIFDQGYAADVPLYGMLLDLMELLFGDGRFAAVVLLQTLISAAALVYFYRTLRLVGARETVARWVILMYGLSTLVSVCNIAILTESLSLSGFTFTLYNVIKFVKFRQWKNGLAGIVLTFALVFLRPQFLLHYLILLVYFVLKAILEKDGRKTAMRLAVICTGGVY